MAVKPSDTIYYLVQIIRDFVGLERDQVVVYNQNWKIPPDKRLYVTVGLLYTKPYGSVRTYEERDGALVEVINLNTQETYDLNIYAYDREALVNKDEVIMALNSTLSQQVQEQFSFKLAKLPTSLKDLSALEGSSNLYRFQADVALLRARRKENVVQYFDKYSNPSLIINP